MRINYVRNPTTFIDIANDTDEEDGYFDVPDKASFMNKFEVATKDFYVMQGQMDQLITKTIEKEQDSQNIISRTLLILDGRTAPINVLGSFNQALDEFGYKLVKK